MMSLSLQEYIKTQHLSLKHQIPKPKRDFRSPMFNFCFGDMSTNRCALLINTIYTYNESRGVFLQLERVIHICYVASEGYSHLACSFKGLYIVYLLCSSKGLQVFVMQLQRAIYMCYAAALERYTCYVASNYQLISLQEIA